MFKHVYVAHGPACCIMRVLHEDNISLTHTCHKQVLIEVKYTLEQAQICDSHLAGPRQQAVRLHFLGGETCEDVMTPVLTDVMYALLLLHPNINERD